MFCFVLRFWGKSVTPSSYCVFNLSVVKTCLGAAAVFASACLRYVKGCVWQRRSEVLLMIWKHKESGGEKSEVEVIESVKRNNSDLQGESGRLFVFLSNSQHNLHGCWQLYTAWKGLCLYLSTQWVMFSTGSAVNLCSVNSLTCSSDNQDRALISVPFINSLDKANFLRQNLFVETAFKRQPSGWVFFPWQRLTDILEPALFKTCCQLLWRYWLEHVTALYSLQTLIQYVFFPHFPNKPT